VHKRCLPHLAGHDPGLLTRRLIGAGTPKDAVAGGYAASFPLLAPIGALVVVLIVQTTGESRPPAFTNVSPISA
jgi:hypothetical protein